MNGTSEIEIVFYAKIGDSEGLKKADAIEHHVQLETRLNNGNKIRVRKTSGPGDENPSYVFTAKKKSRPPSSDVSEQVVQDSTEYNSDVDEKFFDTFSEIMEQRIDKIRYTFKNRSITITLDGVETPIVLGDVCYEVDFFTTNDQVADYVKVDIEVDSILAYINEKYPDLGDLHMKIKPGDLPFKPYDIIFPPKATPEQNELIQNLWKTKFTQQSDQQAEVKTK